MSVFFEDDITTVKFPVLATSALHPSETDFERMKQASVHEMESIKVDDNVLIDDVAGLIHCTDSCIPDGSDEETKR